MLGGGMGGKLLSVFLLWGLSSAALGMDCDGTHKNQIVKQQAGSLKPTLTSEEETRCEQIKRLPAREENYISIRKLESLQDYADIQAHYLLHSPPLSQGEIFKLNKALGAKRHEGDLHISSGTDDLASKFPVSGTWVITKNRLPLGFLQLEPILNLDPELGLPIPEAEYYTDLQFFVLDRVHSKGIGTTALKLLHKEIEPFINKPVKFRQFCQDNFQIKEYAFNFKGLLGMPWTPNNYPSLISQSKSGAKVSFYEVSEAGKIKSIYLTYPAEEISEELLQKYPLLPQLRDLTEKMHEQLMREKALYEYRQLLDPNYN